MRAAVLCAKRDIRIQDIPIPAIRENEVLIRVGYAGVCGSEIARVDGAAHRFPMVQGHEFSGVIEKTGSAVKNLSVGQAVAVAPLVVCGQCEMCLQGLPYACRHSHFIGVAMDGAWSEFAAVPESNVIPLPSGTALRDGAFIEPATVAIHGLDLMALRPGHPLAIVGMGTIGLLTLQAAKLLGAGPTTVFDVNPARLEAAAALGADFCLNSSDPDCLAQVMERTGRRGFPQVVETAGTAAAEVLSVMITGERGKLMYIGTPGKDVTFTRDEFETINKREMTVMGSWMSYSAPFPGWEWQAAAQWLSQGKILLDRLIDRIIPLEALPQAFADIFAGKVSGKVLIQL